MQGRRSGSLRKAYCLRLTGLEERPRRSGNDGGRDRGVTDKGSEGPGNGCVIDPDISKQKRRLECDDGLIEIEVTAEVRQGGNKHTWK